MNSYPKALPWQTMQWLNSDRPLTLEDFAGRVVVAGAFQMLCPGCVSHCLPQLQQVQAAFSLQDVAVVGLHTVFEHHAAMTPVSLKAFLHEYRLDFPVGVDAPGADGDPMPRTMRTYGMQGTPTLLLIDRAGNLRQHIFGQVPDMQLGAEIARLVAN
jgi:thiol-disulfide isomerase/thioredoxin